MGRTAEAKRYYNQLLDLRPDFPGKCRALISRFIKFDDLVECVMDGLGKAGFNENDKGNPPT